MKLESYEPSKSREDVIVHIGTRHVKNPQISIEAVRILRKRGYNVKLMIIGDQINAPNDESIILRRSISEEEKVKILCRAKALILPSSYEGFSYASLEAMACGTPAVVSGAVPEEVVINNFNGIRVSSFNPEDYANALEKLLLNEELWLKLSRNGLEFVKQFDHVRIAKEYEAMIKKAL
jgi:glycosyltransferase involved in cell wall biosynthesis